MSDDKAQVWLDGYVQARVDAMYGPDKPIQEQLLDAQLKALEMGKERDSARAALKCERELVEEAVRVLSIKFDARTETPEDHFQRYLREKAAFLEAAKKERGE